MTRSSFLSTTASAILLAGCSTGGGQHAVCVNAQSTQDYGLKWQEDIAAAKLAGKLTTEQVVQAQGKSYENLGLLKNEDWSGFCNLLDQIRTDVGF